MRAGRSIWLAVLGGAILVVYGIIPAFQPTNFGRVYAAYGGVFILLSLLWGWRVDVKQPDQFDHMGAAVCLAGVFIIMYAPRS